MNTNEGIKRGNSRTKLYQTLFISLNYRLQTELNVHPLINFFLLRDNQFTSVGLHSTIVLKTQVHSNTPCWGLKGEKNGSFRYFLPKLLNCFHVYSSHFKQTVRNQSFHNYRSFDDFSFTTWYKIKCHLPSFLDIFINWISVIWDGKHIPLFNK